MTFCFLKYSLINTYNEVGSIKAKVGSIKAKVGSIKAEIGSIKAEIGSTEIACCARARSRH
jgi:ribonuclease PH